MLKRDDPRGDTELSDRQEGKKQHAKCGNI